MATTSNECSCTPSNVTRYQKRISGPLLDRIDTLRDVEVPRVAYEKLTDQRMGESSETIRARVETAREIQRRRYTSTGLACNADMQSSPADDCSDDMLAATNKSLMRTAMTILLFPASACHRVHKLSRTIAGLAESDDIQPANIAEAI